MRPESNIAAAAAAARYPRTDPIVFQQTGDFEAVNTAVRALEAAGFSVGQMQKGSPRGVLLGNYWISKWRNLSHQQRLDLHAEMHGGRDGPVVITPSVIADDDVLAALEHVRAAADVEPVRLTMLVGGCVTDA